VADLLLADHLLHTDTAARVTLHVKPAPYFVSDATGADVSACLRALAAASDSLPAASRLRAAAAAGTLDVATHPFHCAPLPFRDAPADLVADLAAARLVLVKGDLNYRRLVGDEHGDATEPFASAVAGFPAPVAALRTLKSDVVVGLDPTTLARLDARPGWRTSGEHALSQVRP
jgi:hypothetical protein